MVIYVRTSPPRVAVASHTSAYRNTSNWTPPSIPALWEVYIDQEVPEEVTYPEWQQPSSQNPYKIGDIVRFDGKVYRSRINGNIWSPTSYPAGWELVA